MRATLLILSVLPLFPALSGCDFAFASETTTKWLSRESLLGFVVVEKGGEYEAVMYMFEEKASMPTPESLRDDMPMAGMPFSSGVVDPETKTMLFTLKTTNLVAGNSARLMRENGTPYIEFDLDFSGTEIEGRWRKGDSKPSMRRSFVRCGAVDAEAE